jgi:Tfp pilus assembly protein PilX
MTRWIMLAFVLIGLALVFTVKSPGLLGIGLLLALVGVVGFVLALASDRISANARPETTMASREDLTALRDRAQRMVGNARRAAKPDSTTDRPES